MIGSRCSKEKINLNVGFHDNYDCVLSSSQLYI